MFNPYNKLYGNFVNRKFSDIFPDVDVFTESYKNSGLYKDPNKLSDEGITTLYYLLYARYGNSTIASFDEGQFTYKVFSTMFMYGPAWESKLKLQDELRKLIDDPEKLTDGAFTIYNHSYNPSTDPAADSNLVLKTINDQNTSRFKKGKLDAFAMAAEILKTDVTEEFIGKFKKLFITVVEPNLPLWYETEKE